jgi:hypothetical protein
MAGAPPGCSQINPSARDHHLDMQPGNLRFSLSQFRPRIDCRENLQKACTVPATMMAAARSAKALIVREGLTPNGVGTIAPFGDPDPFRQFPEVRFWPTSSLPNIYPESRAGPRARIGRFPST